MSIEKFDSDAQRANAFSGTRNMNQIMESYGRQVEGYSPERKSHYDRLVRLIERGRLAEAAYADEEFHAGLSEATVVNDLPVLLGGLLDLQVRDAFGNYAQPWRAAFKSENFGSFREQKLWYPLDLGTDDGTIPVVPEAQGYDAATLSEYYEVATLATYGITAMLSRQVIVNDDKRALQSIPRDLGRLMARTQNKAVANVLAANASTTVSGVTTKDGYNLFEVSSTGAHHGNMASGAYGLGSTDDFALVEAQVKAFGKQVVPSAATSTITLNDLGIKPRYLIVPSALELQAMKLVSAAQRIISSGTTAATVVATSANVLAFLQVVVLPELPSDVDWYLAADNAVFPTIEVAYLNGIETPQTWVRSTDFGVSNLAEADGIQYKIRSDWAAYPAAYSGLRKVDVTG